MVTLDEVRAFAQTLPRPSDMRYRWVVARLETIDHAEMEELVLGAWSMCVPKGVAEEYAAAHG